MSSSDEVTADPQALLEAMEGGDELAYRPRDPDATKGSKKEPTEGQLRRRARAVREETEDPNYLTLGEVTALDPFQVVEWKKDGVQPEVFKRLGTGKYSVSYQLDLHRKTVAEAREALYAFLKASHENGARAISIAHGRGERSRTPARIKSYVVHWLEQTPEVIAFKSAPRELGGTGATLVLLRKSDASRERNREIHGLKSAEPPTS